MTGSPIKKLSSRLISYMASIKKLSDDFQKMIDMLINPVRKRLRAEFRRAQRLALKQYFEFRAIDETLWGEHRNRLEDIAIKAFNQSQKAGAMRQLRLFVDDKDITDDERKSFFKDVEQTFESFSIQQARESAQAMADTTRKDIEQIIAKQTELDQAKNQNGILDIIRESRKSAAERSIWRSFVGGLAMVHGGANKGASDSADTVSSKKGFEIVKRWITMRDDRVRDTHIVMDRVEVSKGQLFQVPTGAGGFDQMRYPGDRSASIGNWINCRCLLRHAKAKTNG